MNHPISSDPDTFLYVLSVPFLQHAQASSSCDQVPQHRSSQNQYTIKTRKRINVTNFDVGLTVGANSTTMKMNGRRKLQIYSNQSTTLNTRSRPEKRVVTLAIYRRGIVRITNSTALYVDSPSRRKMDNRTVVVSRERTKRNKKRSKMKQFVTPSNIKSPSVSQ